MITVDLKPSEYRRITEKPPSRWRWDWMDLLIAVLLLALFTIVAIGGGPRLAVGGMLAVGFWIAGFYSRTIAWLAFIARAAGL
jgi:hypothetical protein